MSKNYMIFFPVSIVRLAAAYMEVIILEIPVSLFIMVRLVELETLGKQIMKETVIWLLTSSSFPPVILTTFTS